MGPRQLFGKVILVLEGGNTLRITTLDRLGRSTQNMLAFAEALRGRGAGLRVLNLGGGEVDTATPMGSMVSTVMAALAQMELESSANASPTRWPNAGPPARISEAGARPAPTPGSAVRCG
jgi:DNA invertase Pin-like site-specific DNA recombinase